jgi:hypothetical protein
MLMSKKTRKLNKQEEFLVDPKHQLEVEATKLITALNAVTGLNTTKKNSKSHAATKNAVTNN